MRRRHRVGRHPTNYTDPSRSSASIASRSCASEVAAPRAEKSRLRGRGARGALSIMDVLPVVVAETDRLPTTMPLRMPTPPPVYTREVAR